METALVHKTVEQSTMRKVALRLVPFLCVLYTIAFIDRINVGFAALSMTSDLGLSSAAFGFGAGLFFSSSASGEKGPWGFPRGRPLPDLAVALVGLVQLGGQHLTSASVARPAGAYAGSRARLLRLAFAADSRYNLWHSTEESASGFTDHPVDPCMQKQWREQSR